MDGVFKSCGKCFKNWPERADLVRDRELELIGYQPTFGDPTEGLFLFTHNAARCGTTVAVQVGDFQDYIHTPPETNPPLNMEVCPGHCLRVHDLQACTTPCQIRWVRQLIQVLKRHEVPDEKPGLQIVSQPAQQTA